MTARLSIEEATVRFDELVALDAVDLEVAPGEVVAIVGPSGSGKSTLLRSVAGLQELSAGTVRLDGRDLRGVAVHRRDVGLMFQDQALFPHRDVGGNVGFGLRMRGAPADDIARSVGEMLELVGLPGAERRPIAELSGGEQQRVALARALAPSPRVLLLDEPLGALDRTLRERLVVDLRRLFGELALTVVAVTHDQDEAFALADRIAVMDHGRILQAGTPADVWGSPAGPRVAMLLGLGNVVEADVVSGRAVTPWGEVGVPGAAEGRTWVIVRPTGVVLDPAGTGSATVLTSAFRGERTTLELGLVGATPLQADVPTAAAPRPGATVRFRIDPASVVPLGAV